MENLDLDLTQILKDCPKGTKLYSPIGGDATFKGIVDEEAFPIVVEYNNGIMTAFTKDGKFYDTKDAECMLFPSKDCRDWSTFKIEQLKPQFKPFEKVLVRNHDGQEWEISLYSYFRGGWANPHVCIEDCYNQCIPFEGNEHLLGTICEPKSDKV